MLIKLEQFKGIVPKLSPDLLPVEAAQIAQNCNLESGNLKAFRDLLQVAVPAKAGTKQSIYLFADAFWFHWLADVDVVRGAIAGDTQERTYFTGDGTPKVTDSSIATAGGDQYPTNAWQLGLPAPAVAPTLSPVTPGGTITAITKADPAQVTSAGHGLTTGQRVLLDVTGMTDLDGWEGPVTVIDTDNFTLDNVDSTGYDTFTAGTWQRAWADADKEDRAYVCTFVTGYGEEGPPSDPSDIITCGADQVINLSAIPGPPEGNYNVVKVRIYRTHGGYYLYVGEVVAGTTTLVDNVESASLGESLPSTTWAAPPDDLNGLIELPNGGMAGISGNQVCFCEPYQYHAWPVGYRQAFNDPVALCAFGTSMLVATKAQPYVLTGASPNGMLSEKMEMNYPCVSKRGMADLGYGAVYPSTDGAVLIGVGVAKLATAEILTRDQWQAYKPESLLGVGHNNKYYGFYNTGTKQGGFILDPVNGTFVEIDVYATAAYSDPKTGKLYLQVGDNIKQWDGGSGSLTYVWKSRPFPAPLPINPGAAQVKADAYPVTMKIYSRSSADGEILYAINDAGEQESVYDINGELIFSNGVTKHTQEVANGNPFRLPSGYRGELFEIEITGTSPVRQVFLAEAMRELRQA